MSVGVTSLHIKSRCVMSDEVLYAHMDEAIKLGLEEIATPSGKVDGMILLVGSGPSVANQLETIKQMQAAGSPVVAIKDAHDWLIENGIQPDYAIAIDPQEHRWNCFRLQSERTVYMIASQCHPAMFEHLKDRAVKIWHPYIANGQKHPPKKMVIGGGSTSGLRAISLFYVLGWRHFCLFGFDSSLNGDKLRVNGDAVKPGDQISEIKLEQDGQVYFSTAAMALQAEQFQSYYQMIPDAVFYAFGDGLLQAVMRQRQKQFETLAQVQPITTTGTVSFIHSGDSSMASYRYRVASPAKQNRWKINNYQAETLIFSKPLASELMAMASHLQAGGRLVVDICDDHLEWVHYQEAIRLAHLLTCPTEEMKAKLVKFEKPVYVIPDPYEYDQVAPHCSGTRLLWFGHSVNLDSLQRIWPAIEEYEPRVVSNAKGAVPWTRHGMVDEFADADIVIIPATAAYKSANRAVEATRNGCFVVAEIHPSLTRFPGVWVGDIREGIEWAKLNPKIANKWILEAQKFVTANFSPQICGKAWRQTIKLLTTLDAAKKNGLVGSA